MSDNKVALITGSSQGIGRAIARRMAAEGYEVVITGRNIALLEETEKLIKEAGGKVGLTVPADLSRPEEVERLAKSVLDRYSTVDLLVNNAGVMHLAPFLELQPEKFEEMWAVNMRAVFQLTQLLVPSMIKRGKGGDIVNIASLAGKNGFKNGSGYAATKWALRGWAQCLMLELRQHDIRVITLFPGSVDTALGGGAIRATQTLPKNKMQAADIAEAVAMAVKMPQRTMVSEIDLRPSNPQKQ